jgi:TonB family protein
LARLLVAEVEEPWLRTFIRNVKEFVRPPKLPPLELTSKPVAVKGIWGDYRNGKRASVSSVLIHACAIVLLFTVASNRHVQSAVKQVASLVAPVDLSPYNPEMLAKSQKAGGGGGGGDRSLLPASKGKLPKLSNRQFTPPEAVLNNLHPKLAMDPSIIAQANMPIPNVNMTQLGDPFGKNGPLSNGTGSGGGIGSGSGGGVGSGRGAGFGPGEGGNFGGGVFRVGGGVSAPTLILKVDPEYSEEARKAKFQGTVVLAVVVDETGRATQFKVVRPLGMGLDEKAIEAVQKWRFVPGKKDGHAVAVMATVEVNFRLL